MKGIKQVLAKAFGKIAATSFRHPWLALLLAVGVCIGLVSQLPHLRMDTRNETFFRPDDKVLLDYNKFRDQYGKDEFIILAIEHPNIFSLEFLQKLHNLHQDLEKNIAYLDEVTSLVNVRNTYGKEDELIVEDFLQSWPQNQQHLDLLRLRAKENSLYRNYILSENEQTTAIIIKPLACNPDADVLMQTEGSCEPMSNEQNRQLMAALEEIIAKYESETFPVAVSGMPVVVDYLNLTLEKDLAVIIPTMYLMVILFLAIMFRRVSGVIYPVVIFVCSLVSAIALMAILGIPMTNITIILPSFMLVVSISDAVHILALFYPEYQKSGNREQAIIAAMEHSGLAILMTTVTTAGGLISFAVAKVAPVADLGIVAPIGIVLALFYTVVLLPALLAIFPVKMKAEYSHNRSSERFFKLLSNMSCKYRWLIVGIFLVIVAVSAAGLTKLQFSHLALRWFPKDSQIRIDTELIDNKMHGSVSLDVIIDTGRPDGLYDPVFIQALDEATVKYRTYEYQDLFVGKILDVTTLLKETNRALHGNAQEQYALPKDRELIAQELFLFQLSGADDLDELVDQQFSQTRIAFHLPYRDSVKFKQFVKYLEADLQQRFPEASIAITGVNALFIEMLNNVMVTMMRSYTIALVLISILMIFMLGKLRMGLLSMIPNLLPIVTIMGLMGWFGIALDFGTILIGSISIGIIVDDTIHFLHNFSRYYDQYKDAERATYLSLTTVGRAMVVTSTVLTFGFLCNMLSGLTLNQYSGFLIATTVVVALATDFILMPAILSLVYDKKEEPVAAVEVV